MNSTSAISTPAAESCSDDPGAPADSPEPEPPEPPSPRGNGGGEHPPELDLRVEPRLPARIRSEDREWIERSVCQICRILDRPVHRLDIVILDDDAMRALHKRFLNQDTTTDVLTFVESQSSDPIEADIAVCLDVAVRRCASSADSSPGSADSTAPSWRNELLLYIVHGLLHAIGYDDRNPQSYREMHEEEDRLLSAIGVGRVFSADRAGDDADQRTLVRHRKKES